MSILYKLKIGFYNFFGSKFGKSALLLISKFISVKHLRKSEKKDKKFLVAITIDTESGYVNNDNSRTWQKSEPGAYIGYYRGIENWRNLLNNHNAKGTFFLSTNCFSAKGEEYKKILFQLNSMVEEKHEIGLHTHPDSDLALKESLKRDFTATSARFYDKTEISSIIKNSKAIIRQHTGQDVTSFRWGNWALDTNAVNVLHETKFKIDSSAAPGTKGHLNDGMHYDWSKALKSHPWKLSLKDYQNTNDEDSSVLEMPIATFNLFGLTLRADPAYSVLLNSAFDYYYKFADREDNPFVFVVISHSSEGTHKDGSKTRVIDDSEEFIKHAKKHHDVEFVTIKEASDRIK